MNQNNTDIARKVARDFRLIKEGAGSPTLPRESFLVAQLSGGHLNLYLIDLVDHDKYGKMPGIKGRLAAQKNSKCGEWNIYKAAAAAGTGLGPVLYDAAMELLSPQWVSPDTSPSKAALNVWGFYLERRSDVEKQHKSKVGDQCLDTANDRSEATEYLYRKKPGALASRVMSHDEFSKHKRVVEFFDRPKKFTDLGMQSLDYTPNIPGEWR